MCNNAQPKVGSIDNEQADSQSNQAPSSSNPKSSSSRKPEEADLPQETKRTLNVNVGFLGKFEEEKDENNRSDDDIMCLSIENRFDHTSEQDSA